MRTVQGWCGSVVNMILPEVYVLGAPKAGTTSLSQWLAAHPDVYFSKLKEPVYWADDYPELRSFRGYDNRQSYERLFSSPEAQLSDLRAEGSTVYLYSGDAVANIERNVPHAKFIVALRNPADLVVSFHRTQRLLLNEEEEDFETAWRRNVDGRQPKNLPLDRKLIDYAMVGSLGAAVQRLLDVVPRARVHFIVFDDLIQDNTGEWNRLAAFLGINPLPLPDFAIHNPSSRIFRSKRLHQFRERPPAMLRSTVSRLNQWSASSDNVALRGVKRKLWWREESRPEVSASLKSELARFFADDVEHLGTILGRDFSHWTERYCHRPIS